MSILERFADKPWARPPQYTSEADPSHNEADGAGQPGTPQPGRTPSALGDGRPDPAMADAQPLHYRRGDANAGMDLDDRDELEIAEAYVPVMAPAPEHAALSEGGRLVGAAYAAAKVATPQSVAPERSVPHPHPHPARGDMAHAMRLTVLGVQREAIYLGASAPTFAATAAELEEYALMFSAWARMLRDLQSGR